MVRTWLFVVAILVQLAVPIVASAQGSPRCNFDRSYPRGTVVELDGTPHLWILDGSDLHWAGDTRALAGRTVEWGNRCAMDIDFARRAQKGDPWLSAGLVKIGDPIYIAKWESEEPAPTLLRIQSISDVELFGISGTNYGRFVMGREEWEARYGFNADTLRRGELAAAAAPAPAASSGFTQAPPSGQAPPSSAQPSPQPTAAPTPPVQGSGSPQQGAPSTCTSSRAIVTPSTVRRGESMTVNFQGFQPGSTVTISLSGRGATVSDTSIADSQCRVLGGGAVPIPGNFPLGTFTWSARGTGFDGRPLEVSGSFTVVA